MQGERRQKKVRVYVEGLEVGRPPVSTLPEVAPSFPPVDNRKFLYEGDGTFVTLPKKKVFQGRQKVLLIVAIGILVVLAAVVGAVVGTLKRDHHSSSVSEDPLESNSTSGNSLRNGSSLAVTGWRNEQGYSIRLFYQDVDGYLRISWLDSIAGGKWNEGIQFTEAKSGTPISAVSFNQSIYGTGTDNEVRVYFLNEQSHMQEYVFGSADTTGKKGTLNKQNIVAASGSEFGAYWPSLVYQNPDASLSEVRYNCSTSASDCWNRKDLNISSLAVGSSLAEIPMGPEFSGLILYYQQPNETLANYGWLRSEDEWYVREFEQQIPSKARFGVFGTPRSQNDSYLDFYVLWQDLSGTVQVSWLQDGPGWNGPTTFSAFGGALDGTAIACLNPSSWFTDDLRLQYGSQMSRCYFQGRAGHLKEMEFDGSQWQPLGLVHLGKDD